MKELIRKLGEYNNSHRVTRAELSIYYLLCKIYYG